jgi:hypothetical protein
MFTRKFLSGKKISLNVITEPDIYRQVPLWWKKFQM